MAQLILAFVLGIVCTVNLIISLDVHKFELTIPLDDSAIWFGEHMLLQNALIEMGCKNHVDGVEYSLISIVKTVRTIWFHRTQLPWMEC